jgi:hypothetical protein
MGPMKRVAMRLGCVGVGFQRSNDRHSLSESAIPEQAKRGTRGKSFFQPHSVFALNPTTSSVLVYPPRIKTHLHRLR